MKDLLKKLKKLTRKDYRNGYMQSRVRSNIAYQILALRKKFGMSQTEMAEKTGKKQSVISRLEDPEYGRVTLGSLLDIASSLDVALLVQFVSYPDFLERTSDMSEAALQPETIDESMNRLAVDQFRQNEMVMPTRTYAKPLSATFASQMWEQQQIQPKSEGALEAHKNRSVETFRKSPLVIGRSIKNTNEAPWISLRWN